MTTTRPRTFCPGLRSLAAGVALRSGRVLALRIPVFRIYCLASRRPRTVLLRIGRQGPLRPGEHRRMNDRERAGELTTPHRATSATSPPLPCLAVSANARSGLIGGTPKANARSPVVAVQQIDMIAVKNHGQGHVRSDTDEKGNAAGRNLPCGGNVGVRATFVSILWEPAMRNLGWRRVRRSAAPRLGWRGALAHCTVFGGLRRTTLRPPTARYQARHGEGGRLGINPCGRPRVQAAELDEPAVPHRGGAGR